MSIKLSDKLRQRYSKYDSWIVASSNIIVKDGDNISADVSAGSFTITLPAFPLNGQSIKVSQGPGSFALNPVILDRNGQSIMGLNENMNLDIDNVSVELVFNNGDWRIA